MRTVGDDVKHALCVRLINRVKSALSGLSLRGDPYEKILILPVAIETCVLTALSVAHNYEQFSQSVSGQWLRSHVGLGNSIF